MTSQEIIIMVVKWRNGGATRPACIKKLINELEIPSQEAQNLVYTAWEH